MKNQDLPSSGTVLESSAERQRGVGEVLTEGMFVHNGEESSGQGA